MIRVKKIRAHPEPKNKVPKNFHARCSDKAFHLNVKNSLNAFESTVFIALKSLSYRPIINAIVPEDIPGINSEIPIKNPRKNKLKKECIN